MAQSINGPNAHIQGIEAQWEQRFSFLPGLLGGFGVNANYSHTVSQVTFPVGFDGGRTDRPSLDRTSPNDYNFNLTYDRNRFSGRLPSAITTRALRPMDGTPVRARPTIRSSD